MSLWKKTSVREYADVGETRYRTYAYTYDFAGRLASEKGSYVIGTNGETKIKIVVSKPGSSSIITAYPVE